MADRQVQIEFTKMKLELKRLVLSTIAILEEVQDQNPTTWDQLEEMMMTAGESGDLGERLQSLVFSDTCLDYKLVVVGFFCFDDD